MLAVAGLLGPEIGIAFLGFICGSGGTLAMRVGHKSILIFTFFSLILLGGQVPAAAQYWSNSCLYRRAITINHTKVPNTDQTNFPVSVSGTYSDVATVANGGKVTNTNGYDILFAS